MFQRLLRFGENLSLFSEWVRIFPVALTKTGRGELVEQFLSFAEYNSELLAEARTYAHQVTTLYDKKMSEAELELFNEKSDAGTEIQMSDSEICSDGDTSPSTQSQKDIKDCEKGLGLHPQP